MPSLLSIIALVVSIAALGVVAATRIIERRRRVRAGKEAAKLLAEWARLGLETPARQWLSLRPTAEECRVKIKWEDT